MSTRNTLVESVFAAWIGLLGVVALSGCSDTVRADRVAMPDGVCTVEEVDRSTDGGTSYEIRDALLVWCNEPMADSLMEFMVVELGRQFHELGPVLEPAGQEFAFRGRSGDVVVRETNTYRRVTNTSIKVDALHRAIDELPGDVDSVVLTTSAERPWSDRLMRED